MVTTKGDAGSIGVTSDALLHNVAQLVNNLTARCINWMLCLMHSNASETQMSVAVILDEYNCLLLKKSLNRIPPNPISQYTYIWSI